MNTSQKKLCYYTKHVIVVMKFTFYVYGKDRISVGLPDVQIEICCGFCQSPKEKTRIFLDDSHLPVFTYSVSMLFPFHSALWNS